MTIPTPLYSIVLAAGKGRRMRSREKHKVCFDIAGVPAIVRVLEAHNRLGVDMNVVVIGEFAGQVVETVGQRFSKVTFAYQREALGTGNATRCGLQALKGVDDDARVLVVAGDKLVESATLIRLLEHFESTSSDLAFLVSPAEFASRSAGRVLFRPDGNPMAIVEFSDINLLACRCALHQEIASNRTSANSAADLARIVSEHVGPGTSWSVVLGDRTWDSRRIESSDPTAILAALDRLPRQFSFESLGLTIGAGEAARSRFCNESVYLVRKGALRYGLNHMSVNNAQGEEYLTDAMTAIMSTPEKSHHFKSSFVPIQNTAEVMSYNNPEELLVIEDRLLGQRKRSMDHLSERLGPERFRSIEDWLDIFPDRDLPAGTAEALRAYYGNDPTVLAERTSAYRTTLLGFREAFGRDRKLILVRSPGRINVMGRHIDWQGGHCNLMAVNQEVIMAVAPRSDDRLEIRNVRPDLFPSTSVSLGRLVSELEWDDWLKCVNSQELQRRLREAAGHWSLYIEAGMLRLQMEFRQQRLSGMDMLVNGNIPLAAGMSSSSALVVSTAEAALALNGLDLVPRQFVNFCGEGEWFVGTRGGSADHAAMKFGNKGMVTHAKFHEFELVERVRFPEQYRIAVCNSFLAARKAAGAKAIFNSRVASYLLGVALVRRNFPQYAPFVRFVRDINPETLHVPVSQIYRVLMNLPQSMSAAEARQMFADNADTLSQLAAHFDSPDAPGEYPVRGVMLFGISECARAVKAIDCLRQADMEALGELMSISHNGERCFLVADDLTASPYCADVSDDYLAGLVADLESGDPLRVENAELHRQPGGYRCSVPEIDAIVDIATRTPGVLGAQIAGAGLGGCAMVLVAVDAIDRLTARLNDLFYCPKGLPSGVLICTPAAGSCVVSIAS